MAKAKRCVNRQKSSLNNQRQGAIAVGQKTSRLPIFRSEKVGSLLEFVRLSSDNHSFTNSTSLPCFFPICSKRQGTVE